MADDISSGLVFDPKKHAYYLSGTRIPSVTQILDMWADGQHALMGWAAKLAREGLDHHVERRRAADIGTRLHEIAATALTTGWDTSILRDDDGDEVRTATDSWLSWVDAHEIVPEIIESPLAHAGHLFAGTIDFVGIVDGVRCIFDWKTSSRYGPKMAIQLAAYWMLYDLAHPDAPVERAIALRCDKRIVRHEEHDVTRQKSDATRAFVALLDAYRWTRLVSA